MENETTPRAGSRDSDSGLLIPDSGPPSGPQYFHFGRKYLYRLDADRKKVWYWGGAHWIRTRLVEANKLNPEERLSNKDALGLFPEAFRS